MTVDAVEMTPEVAAKLREPFPDEAIGYLPKIWCKACSDNGKQRRHGCDSHERKRCMKCRNNITEAHVDLSYVGHAETTDRLIAVDPLWTWEPMAFGADGLPVLDQYGGLWIRLTVAGVTRPGYGGAAGKSGPDAVKELIGDAIRNAAMRFGVAINLWGAHGKGEALAELAGMTGEAPEGSSAADAPATAPISGREAMGVVQRSRRDEQDPDGEGPPIVGASNRSSHAEEPARERPAPAEGATEADLRKAANGLLNATAQQTAEWWANKVGDEEGAKYPARADVSALVTEDDVNALGDRLDTPVTLGDLAAAVLGYWQDWKAGPRQKQAQPA